MTRKSYDPYCAKFDGPLKRRDRIKNLPVDGDTAFPVKEAPAGGACGEPPQRTKSFPAPELSSRAQDPSSPLFQEMFVPKNKTELLLVPEASESMTKAPAASVKGGMTSV